jgi:hypothetical protein
LKSHFFQLVVYSTLVSAYFGVLLRRRPGAQFRLASVIWLAMVGGALILAYAMFPFPH